MPMISNPTSGLISATTTAIFEVPMSSPTIRCLLSLTLLIRTSPHSSGHAHCKAVGVTQIDVIRSVRQLAHGTGICRNETIETCFNVVAPKFKSEAARELQPPGATQRHLHLRRSIVKRCQSTTKIVVLDRNFLGARRIRTDEYRQHTIVSCSEYFTVNVDQRIIAPARERHLLLERNVDAIRPLASHVGRAHPRQSLKPGAQPLQIQREEVAGNVLSGDFLDLIARNMYQRVAHTQLMQRKYRLSYDEQPHAIGGKHQRSCEQQVRDGI